MTDAQDESQIDRTQLKTALQLLEGAHGQALQIEDQKQARAFYHAITVVEGALEEEYKLPENITISDWERENIERSRKAREAGPREATLTRTNHGTQAEVKKSRLQRFMEGFR